MSSVFRIWLAMAAIGAALIHLAVGAGAPLPLSIILVGLGIAELGWGVVTLIRGRLVARDAAIPLALVPVFVWGATAILGGGLGVSADDTVLPFYPMAVASLFGIVLSVALAVGRRREANRTTTDAAATSLRTPSELPAWGFLAAVMISSLVFSGLTTTALSATRAGEHAVPHGTPSVPASDAPPSTHSDH